MENKDDDDDDDDDDVHYVEQPLEGDEASVKIRG